MKELPVLFCLMKAKNEGVTSFILFDESKKWGSYQFYFLGGAPLE